MVLNLELTITQAEDGMGTSQAKLTLDGNPLKEVAFALLLAGEIEGVQMAGVSSPALLLSLITQAQGYVSSQQAALFAALLSPPAPPAVPVSAA